MRVPWRICVRAGGCNCRPQVTTADTQASYLVGQTCFLFGAVAPCRGMPVLAERLEGVDSKPKAANSRPPKQRLCLTILPAMWFGHIQHTMEMHKHYAGAQRHIDAKTKPNL